MRDCQQYIYNRRYTTFYTTSTNQSKPISHVLTLNIKYKVEVLSMRNDLELNEPWFFSSPPVCSHVALTEHVYMSATCKHVTHRKLFWFWTLSEVAHAFRPLVFAQPGMRAITAAGQLHKASLAAWLSDHELTPPFIPVTVRETCLNNRTALLYRSLRQSSDSSEKERHLCSYKASLLFLHLNIAMGI